MLLQKRHIPCHTRVYWLYWHCFSHRGLTARFCSLIITLLIIESLKCDLYRTMNDIGYWSFLFSILLQSYQYFLQLLRQQLLGLQQPQRVKFTNYLDKNQQLFFRATLLRTCYVTLPVHNLWLWHVGIEVGLGQGHIVLDGNPSAPPRGTAPRSFRLTFIVATKGRPSEQLLSSCSNNLCQQMLLRKSHIPSRTRILSRCLIGRGLKEIMWVVKRSRHSDWNHWT